MEKPEIEALKKVNWLKVSLISIIISIIINFNWILEHGLIFSTVHLLSWFFGAFVAVGFISFIKKLN